MDSQWELERAGWPASMPCQLSHRCGPRISSLAAALARLTASSLASCPLCPVWRPADRSLRVGRRDTAKPIPGRGAPGAAPARRGRSSSRPLLVAPGGSARPPRRPCEPYEQFVEEWRAATLAHTPCRSRGGSEELLAGVGARGRRPRDRPRSSQTVVSATAERRVAPSAHEDLTRARNQRIGEFVRGPKTDGANFALICVPHPGPRSERALQKGALETTG